MVRRYEHPVEVSSRGGRETAVPGDGERDGVGSPPDSFLWRGRLYVVRSVLGHWRERRAWWAEQAARAVHGEAEAPDPSSDAGAGGLGGEREVWRVEASAGRAAGSGVYDLCRGSVSNWSLVCVAD
jgi:hypothetical protein